MVLHVECVHTIVIKWLQQQAGSGPTHRKVMFSSIEIGDGDNLKEIIKDNQYWLLSLDCLFNDYMT